ncbi:hypothetical protein DBR06_SOUSAS12610010, partial [Sousa chinensis]
MQQMFTMGIEDKGELSVLFSASIKYQRVVQPKDFAKSSVTEGYLISHAHVEVSAHVLVLS